MSPTAASLVMDGVLVRVMAGFATSIETDSESVTGAKLPVAGVADRVAVLVTSVPPSTSACVIV